MPNDLEPGDARSGMLIQGFENAEYITCAVQYNVGKPPLVTVPYVEGRPEFEGLPHAFRGGSLPKSALYSDHQGPLTFTSLRWRGTNHGNPVSEMRFDSDVTFLGEPRELLDDYRVEEFTSYIDGLEQATNFRTVNTNSNTRTDSEPLTVSIEEIAPLTWSNGQVTYAVGVATPWSGTSGQSFTARTRVYLQTTVRGGVTVAEHLQAQWPIRALLVLLHGTRLSWREHRIRDDQFPLWMTNGPSSHREYVKVIPRRTVRDFEQPKPPFAAVALPLLYFEQLGPERLARWIELYHDPDIARAVEPSVEVINGMSNFLEPQLMMAILGLDAFGYVKLGPQRRDLWINIKACIDATGIDFSALGSNEVVAKALANTNNDLKHPDRRRRPDSIELGLAVDMAIAILRMQIFDLLHIEEDLARNARGSRDIEGAIQNFSRNGITVAEMRENGRNIARFVPSNEEVAAEGEDA